MKVFKILIIGFLCSGKLNAQTTITTSTILVKGNCEECKERIENAADIKGVKNAIWNEQTKVLTVTYDTNKVSVSQIEKVIAKAGHETSNQQADSTAYKKLPACCKYQTTECKK